MSGPYRYKAFISYAHADRKTAELLFRRIETFRTPKGLVGTSGLWGAVPARLTPAFRDREELSTASALGDVLTNALKDSEFLVVLCSPAAARSRWVNEEIRTYRSMHGAQRVLAIIAEGDPAAPVGEGLAGCFPPALLAPAVAGGAPEEPIAADLRGDGDGDRLAFLKLAAGMLGVGLDDLVHREARRRHRIQAAITALSSAIALVFAAVALFAVEQRKEAERQRAIAVDERDTAASALDYLVGIFAIANPATENPKTITALTVLDRGRKKIDETFADKPAVQAKLLGAMGDIYANLGEVETAKATLEAAISKPGGAFEDRLDAEFRLADVLTKSVKTEEAAKVLDGIETRLADAEGLAPARLALFQGRLSERRGDVDWYAARDARALDHYSAAKLHYAAAGAEARVFLARAASTRGIILSRNKRFEEAAMELGEALGMQRDLHGADHLETAIALHNLAYMHFEAGATDKAASELSRAIEVYKRVLEPNHPTASTAILLLARILEKSGDRRAAVAAHRESVASAKAAFGPDNENVGFRLLFLAKAEADSGLSDVALATIDEAQAIYDARFPAGDFNHGDIDVYRALVLAAAGRRAEAREKCAEGLAILARNLAAEDPYLAEMKAHCAPIG
jgi:tetratricopeptide (TPR) repeat protein